MFKVNDLVLIQKTNTPFEGFYGRIVEQKMNNKELYEVITPLGNKIFHESYLTPVTYRFVEQNDSVFVVSIPGTSHKKVEAVIVSVRNIPIIGVRFNNRIYSVAMHDIIPYPANMRKSVDLKSEDFCNNEGIENSDKICINDKACINDWCASIDASNTSIKPVDDTKQYINPIIINKKPIKLNFKL